MVPVICKKTLPEIKSGDIDGAILRGAAWQRCCRRSRPSAKSTHPCSAISACGPRCNISDTIQAGDEDAAPRKQRHSPSCPCRKLKSAHIDGAIRLEWV